MPDIDIDFPSNFTPTSIFKEAIPASMVKQGELVKHPCGHYFQTMPIDPITGIAAIPYKDAEDYEFFKIDFLHLSVLDNFQNKEQIRGLINEEPDWNILLDPGSVSKLFQINKQHTLVSTVMPRSVEELADCVALIRPGKREHLQKYLNDREGTRALLYRSGSDDKSAFKRSHAIAYALTIVLQLHLIDLGLL